MDDRSAAIKIDGVEYELILTTLATKEITRKFGGIESAGNVLLASEDVTEMFDTVVWLIVLMANQSILRHNLKNKNDAKPLLTTEEVELLTEPSDLMDFKDALMDAMTKGTKRFVTSEDDGKNTEAG